MELSYGTSTNVEISTGNVSNLTSSLATSDYFPVWSSNGEKSKFLSVEQEPYDSNRELFVLDSNGGNRIKLTSYEPITVWDVCPMWDSTG